jgi:hypothetical protein
MQIYISIKDDFIETPNENIIPKTKLNRSEFGHVYELLGENPVAKLICDLHLEKFK